MSNPLRRWRLKSKTPDNLRDLGGYACRGGVTRYGVLLRSDILYGLTGEDKDYLVQKGLTDVVDLRSAGEQECDPNAFADYDNVTVHGFQPWISAGRSDSDSSVSTCMGHEYIKKIDIYGEYYVKVLDTISLAKGMVIVHCFAGKDRTGIVSALLLLLLGVDELDVIADYQTSETFLKYRIKQEFDIHPDTPRFIWLSDAANMQMLIDHLQCQYGGAEGYLRAHGLTNRQLERLFRRIVANE